MKFWYLRRVKTFSDHWSLRSLNVLEHGNMIVTWLVTYLAQS